MDSRRVLSEKILASLLSFDVPLIFSIGIGIFFFSNSGNKNTTNFTILMEQENTVEPIHPLRKLHPNVKGFDAVSAKESCRKYLVDFLATQQCHRPKGMGPRETKCSCLTFMKEDSATVEVDCVANYMLYWAGLTGSIQNELFGNWIRMKPALAETSQDKRRCYVLPLHSLR